MAIPIWGGVMGFRWFDYRRRALQQEELASVLMQEIEVFKFQRQDAEYENRLAAKAELNSGIQTRRTALTEVLHEASQYRRAMQQPWRSVGSNP